MSVFFKKYGYKIVAWLFLILSLLFFYNRFSSLTFDFESVRKSIDLHEIGWLVIAFILLFVNWGIESYKWLVAVKPVQNISFSKAYVGVLMGVAVSTVFPNRTGEFVGKILVLEKENKLKGIFSSMFTGLTQLLITFIFGFLCIYFTEVKYYESYIDYLKIALGILAFVFVFLFAFKPLLLGFLKYLPEKWLNFLTFLKQYSVLVILNLILLSVFRYLVFSFQLFALFRFFGAHIAIIDFFLFSSSSFLLTTIIPTTSISELFIRSNVGIIFFGSLMISDEKIIFAYTALWLINILIPSLMGFYFAVKNNWIYSSSNKLFSSEGK